MDSRARFPSGRQGVVLVAVVAVALIASGTLLVPAPHAGWNYLPASSPAASSSSPGSPSPQPSVVASPSPAAEGEWGALALPPVVLDADLRPTHPDGSRVALDSAFVLAATAVVPAAEIARTLTVEPAVEFTRTPRADGSITLVPSSPLEPGVLYRFTARAPDGSLAGSWAFQAASPLRVVGTLPADSATGVPVATGIELTFDQDGTLDAAGHLSIVPKVAGRLEQHGRTLVFVPERLAPATVYTVTLSKGVGLAGSSQRLEKDFRFRFETAGPEEAAGRSIVFDRTMVEATPAEQAVLAFASWDTGGSDPGPQQVAVYRLASATAGLEAARTLASAPAWAMWPSAGVVPTGGLRRVASFTAHPQDLGDGYEYWFRLPAPLPAGWYLVVVAAGRRDAQALLQVTDIATFSAVSSTRSVLWANDAATGTPLADAVVRLGSVVLGRTNGQGLLDVPTPDGLAEAATDPGLDPAILSVTAADGRIAYIPVAPADGGGAYPWDISRWGLRTSDPWWHLLATDRLVYRSTDSVNVWGMVRPRQGLAPSSVELRLVAGWGDAGTLPEPPAIATVDAALDGAGAFAHRIPISDLPTGSYTVELRVGGKTVATRTLSVDVIRKPAYQVTLTTNRRAVVVGDPVTLDATVRFFDGTPVPGAPLAVSLFDKTAATTDAQGQATVTRPATIEGNQGWDLAWANVAPARTEEGEIVGSTGLLVFPSSHWVEGSGTVVDGRGVVTGSVSEVALDRLQGFDPEAFGSLDPRGAPVAGAAVSAVITELVPVRTRTISTYDFIEKKVVDSYEYRIDRREAGRKTTVAGADGSFRIEFPAGSGHDYEVDLRTTDERGLAMHATVYAGKPYDALQPSARPYLGHAATCGSSVDLYAAGEQITVTMRDGKGSLPEGGTNRYLFLTAQQGIRDAMVQGSATYAATFTAADAPNLTIAGVRFTGRTYVPATPTTAALRTDERAITVRLTADRPRYAPGDTVRLSVETLDAAGRPIPASVVVRAVDEKLYALGDAMDEASLADLYTQLSSGLAWSHSSHPLPMRMTGWGCGDATGGGGSAGGTVTQPRQDFRDWLLFDRLTTGPDGRASTSFRLSDDLTSWHVAASAMTSGLGAGDGSLLVPVGLPFFVEATVAPEYLRADRPIVRLRAFGSALHEGDPVTFAVSSTSLGLERTTITGIAFRDVDVALPALTLGAHQLTIEGSAGHGQAIVRDSLVRSFRVVDTRLTRTETTYLPLTAGLRPAPAAGFATYVLTDEGRGRYLGQLFELASSSGARVDQALAASIAHDLLVDRFAVPADAIAPVAFDRTAYQNQGIALLPYASPDLALSARIALLAPTGFDTAALRQLFISARNDPASTREQRVIADAALASLHENVLTDLRSWAADPSLTIRERLYVALGSTALGDNATALSVERRLLASYGERLGAWARLRTGDTLDDTIEATALAALVAGRVGDPVADALEQYVADNRARDDLYSLQQVAFVAAMLDRLPASNARFAFTVAGQREVVDLATGGAYAMTLTPAQQASLVLDPVEGSVGLALTRQVPVASAAVRDDPSLRLVRSISTAADRVRSEALVEVTLTATFGPQAVDDCYTVTDLVPSGLVPVTNVAPWPSADGASPSTLLSPSRVDGQRVEFCAAPSPRSRTASMHYFARVSTTGSYLWEPAVMQSGRASESLALTGSEVITAR